MKTMKKITMMLAVSAMLVISARGQDFLNLNFESAQNLPGNPGNGVSIAVANALPGWTAYDGLLALSDVFFVSNNFTGIATTVELEGGTLALSGNLSVGLYSNSSLSQTGVVPGTAESLQFEAYGPGPGGSLGGSDLGVTLGGQSLSLLPLSTGPNYVVYGANIPADLAGQTEALTFLTQGSGGVLLDNIEFSPMSIPEPGTLALAGLGGLSLLLFRRQRA
jgi:hypothetical protein